MKKSGYCKIKNGYGHDGGIYEYTIRYNLKGYVNKYISVEYNIIGLNGWHCVSITNFESMFEEISELEYNMAKYNL